MLDHAPTTLAECDERLAKVQQARKECCRGEDVLRRAYDDQIDELLACRSALIPTPRET